MLIHMDSTIGVVYPFESARSGNADMIEMQSTYWIPQLPTDGRLGIAITWSEFPLPPATTWLHLDIPERLDELVIPLP